MSDIVERLRHCSDGTRDEYLHELTGRSADLIEQQAREIARLREVMERCAVIVDRNLYHQHEKVEDVPLLLRAALEKSNVE